LETTDIPGLGVPGRVITVAGKSDLVKEAVRMAPPLLKALEEYFGEPYPYAKLDLVAVPEFWAGAMENVGFITFRETILLVDPKEATVRAKRGMASTMTHEMAHMWFGDKVTMDWWDDLWLNESFATWLGNKITDRVFPEYSIAVTNVLGVEGAMRTDAQQNARAIRQPVTNEVQLLQAADGPTYEKGMAVLGMFENWMGEDLFRKTILTYVKENAWGNAVAADLWASMSEASGVDIGTAMSTFLDQPGVPLLSVSDLGDGKISLHQERFANYGAKNKMAQTWQLPVVLRYSDGEQVRTVRTLMSSPQETLDLPTTGKLAWIHPNDDERGYYHWDVDPATLNRLSKDAVDIMNPRERVAFVGQVSALLDAGRIDGGNYLKVIANLADDPRPEVIAAMTGAMGKVRMAFVTPDLESAFANYVSKMLGPARERFGLTPRIGESEAAALLRPNLISWLGKYAHDKDVIAYARSTTEAYLDGQGTADPSVLGQCMQITALEGGGWRLYNKYKKGFETSKIPADRSRYLAGLGWFTDPAMIQHALYYCLHGDLRPQEIFTIPMGIGQTGNEDHTKLLWDWMTSNYDQLMEKMPPMFAVYMPYFAAGCSADRIEAARAFFAQDGPHYKAGQEKELDKVAEGVGDCLGLREREGDAVREYLVHVAGL
jgi:alanyl aminopeptidase